MLLRLWGRCFFGVLLVAALVVVDSGADIEAKGPLPTAPEKPSNQAQTETDQAVLPIAKLISTCNDDFGRIWDAENLTCGEPMTEYACCEASILARFPGFAKKLTAFFEKVGDQKLYNCGQVNGTTTKLHWVEVNDRKFNYTYLTLKGAAKEDIQETVACKKTDSGPGTGAKTYDGSIDQIYPIEAQSTENITEAPATPNGDQTDVTPIPSDEEKPEPEEANNNPAPEEEPNNNQEEDNLEGQTLFTTNCLACHNQNKPIKSNTLKAYKNAIATQDIMSQIPALKAISDEDLEKIAAFAKTL